MEHHPDDLLLGQLARERNWVTPEQLQAALQMCEVARASQPVETLPDILVRWGWLTPQQAATLRAEAEARAQRTEDVQFGQIAADNEFVTRTQVRSALQRQSDEQRRGRFRRLHEILESQGLLSDQEVRAVRKAQERIRSQSPQPKSPPPPDESGLPWRTSGGTMSPGQVTALPGGAGAKPEGSPTADPPPPTGESGAPGGA